MDMAEHRENVLRQLSARFTGRLSAEVVMSEFERAEADLEGQVRPDAAPELLYRLVVHRLEDRCSEEPPIRPAIPPAGRSG